MFIVAILVLTHQTCACWGFYGHRKINYQAVFLLPPEMLLLYKPNIAFLTDHAVDPDMRRYAILAEAPRHYIDIDHYGDHPFDVLPRTWKAAVEKFSEDSLQAHGIVPWWIQTMLFRLTEAFKEKKQTAILKLSAELGHYIADAHVPLHTSSNHNGQKTNQVGIHGFWESRIPELLADTEWDFFIGHAIYIENPLAFTWNRIRESAAAADTVLKYEKELSEQFPADRKYAFEERNGKLIRQYSASFTRAYDIKLKGMVERRMRQAIFAVASFWYTAWINAGQPNLNDCNSKTFSAEEEKEFQQLNRAWNQSSGKEEE